MIKEILYIPTAYYSLLRDEHTVFIYSTSFLPKRLCISFFWETQKKTFRKTLPL